MKIITITDIVILTGNWVNTVMSKHNVRNIKEFDTQLVKITEERLIPMSNESRFQDDWLFTYITANDVIISHYDVNDGGYLPIWVIKHRNGHLSAELLK